MPKTHLTFIFAVALAAAPLAQAGRKPDARVERLKNEAAAAVDAMQGLTQQMVDQVFSYGELGFQETETSRYLIGILEKNGFTVQDGIAGVPTAFMASWGSGRPVIALSSCSGRPVRNALWCRGS